MRAFMTHDLPDVTVTGGKGEHLKQTTSDMTPKEFDRALLAAGKAVDRSKEKKPFITTHGLLSPEEKAAADKRARVAQEIKARPEKAKRGRPAKKAARKASQGPAPAPDRGTAPQPGQGEALRPE